MGESVLQQAMAKDEGQSAHLGQVPAMQVSSYEPGISDDWNIGEEFLAHGHLEAVCGEFMEVWESLGA